MIVNRFGDRKRVLSFPKFMTTAISVIGIFAASVFGLAVNESDSYYLLLNRAKDSAGAFLGTFSDSNDGDGSESDLVDGEDGWLYRWEYAGGTGINLDLIDRIPDVDSGKVGYIKELLTIYRDSQNGKLTQKKIEKPLSVQTLLAMHTNEISLVNAGGDKLPRYYFKPSEWKKNTPHYCFMDYTTKSFNQGHRSGGVSESGGFGIYQNLNTANGAISTADPLSVERGFSSGGDVRFLPDMIRTSADKWQSFLDSFLTAEGKKALTPSMENFLAAASNNRGGPGMSRFLRGLNDLYHDNLVGSKLGRQAIENTIGAWSELFDGYYNDNSSNVKIEGMVEWDAVHQRIAPVVIAAHYDDWYFSDTKSGDTNFIYYLFSKYRTCTADVYKALYPDEYKKDRNLSDLKAKVEDRICTVSESIQRTTGDSSVSAQDCIRVYGTNTYMDGDYRYIQDKSQGRSIWHVSKVKDTKGCYKNRYCNGSDPYILTSFDYIGAGYLFNVCNMKSATYYAYLLKVAGVNTVDPTNPETYTGSQRVLVRYRVATKVTSSDIATQQATYNGKLDNVYANHNVTLTNLSEDRIVVLNKAADIAYHCDWIYNMEYDDGAKGWGRNVQGNVGWRTDCAHFVCMSYRFAGFKDLRYNTTDGFINGSHAGWEIINFKDILPGDALCYRSGGHGHAIIYLSGKKKSNIIVIEAQGEDGKSRADQVMIKSRTDCVSNGYSCFRLKKIDKGKRGKPSKVPKNKNDPMPINIY